MAYMLFHLGKSQNEPEIQLKTMEAFLERLLFPFLIFGTFELPGDLIHQFCFFFPWAHQNRTVIKLRLFWVVVSKMCLFLTPIYLGKIPILTDSFKLGWNHQLVVFLVRLLSQNPLRPQSWAHRRFAMEHSMVLNCSRDQRGLTKNTDGRTMFQRYDILRWRFVYWYHPKK